jgi:tyrocidine synthetase-3
MYRTGDLGWMDSGGVVYCSGRIDDQIKISGYRIEPGEIQAAILESGMAKQVAIIAGKVGGTINHLLAFIVPAEKELFDELALRAYLGKSIPGYMIPARFCLLREIPLTSNGKADIQKLEFLATTLKQDSEDELLLDQEDLELIRIWKEVFGLLVITKKDTFFQLGGNSILLIKFNRRIEQHFGVRISITSYFPDFTPASLREIICKAQFNATINNPSSSLYNSVTAAQEQLFIANRLRPEDPFPNSPITFKLPVRPDTGALNKAVREVIGRHEALRTQFYYKAGNVYSRVLMTAGQDVVTAEINASCIQEGINRITRAFDFSQLPLIRFYLITCPDADYFHIDMPHICSDGISTAFIAEEIAALLDGKSLPPVKGQYKDYLLHYSAYMQSDMFQQDKQFWLSMGLQEKYTGAKKIEMKNVSADRRGKSVISKLQFPRMAGGGFGVQYGNLAIRVEQLLAAALLLAFEKGFGHRIRVMIPVHNRTTSMLENITGLLTNTIILPFDILPGQTVGEFLSYIQRKLTTAMTHQQYPVEYVQKDYRKNGHMGSLFDIFFNYHNYIRDIDTLNGSWAFYVHAKDREMLPLSIDVFSNTQASLRILSASLSVSLSDLEKMTQRYQHLLNRVSESHSIKLADFLPEFNQNI